MRNYTFSFYCESGNTQITMAFRNFYNIKMEHCNAFGTDTEISSHKDILK